MSEKVVVQKSVPGTNLTKPTEVDVVTAGPATAGAIPSIGIDGVIDPTLIPPADAISLRGTPLYNQAPLPGQVLIFDEVTGNYVPGDPIVSGPDAPGVAPTRNPVQMGGFDGAVVRRVMVDANGNLLFIPQAAPSGGFLWVTGVSGSAVIPIKSSPGKLSGWYIFNTNNAVVYVQFFNALSTNVNLGTTVPGPVLPIPPNSGANVMGETGIDFSVAISFAITTTRNGSNPPSSEVDYNFFYK